MISSRWQKQNTHFLYIGPAVIIGLYLMVGNLVRSLGFERNWVTLLITSLVSVVTIIVAYVLMKLRAKSMTRVLKLDNETTEFALRKLLKDKHIQFRRQKDGGETLFEFPGHSLTMTVESYFLHNFVFTAKKNPQPATLVSLKQLDATNQSFADTLALAIDEMATQQPDRWNYN